MSHFDLHVIAGLPANERAAAVKALAERGKLQGLPPADLTQLTEILLTAK